MTEFQAAIGLAQLPKLERWNAQRHANAAFLTRHLQAVPGVVAPPIRPSAQHVFHQYTIRVRHRDQVLPVVVEQGVGAGVYYPVPIHRQPSYQRLGYDENLAESERASREVMSLPVHPSLSQDDLDRVVEAVAAAVESARSAQVGTAR
jgi:dTDP-4-amino-4,6-dideoxygalactose transaminase